VTTHQAELLKEIADGALVLERGRIVMESRSALSPSSEALAPSPMGGP
jgi:ABC-type glutathione transport system ATPase component